MSEIAKVESRDEIVEESRIEVEKSILVVLLALSDQDGDVSLAAQHVLISFGSYLSDSCAELIEKEAGKSNRRLHCGEFTSEFVSRLTIANVDNNDGDNDNNLIGNILDNCVTSLASHNRYIRGQTSTIIGNDSLLDTYKL